MKIGLVLYCLLSNAPSQIWLDGSRDHQPCIFKMLVARSRTEDRSLSSSTSSFTHTFIRQILHQSIAFILILLSSISITQFRQYNTNPIFIQHLYWVILMDDNKMSMKAIDWCCICLMNVCVKNDVEDVPLSLIERRRSMITWSIWANALEQGTKWKGLLPRATKNLTASYKFRAKPASDSSPLLCALIRCLLLLLLVHYFVLNRLILFP